MAEVKKPKTYNFGEKKEEYSAQHKKNLKVVLTNKYITAKNKAIELLESDTFKGILEESDFWILMNTTKKEEMAYTGLIISHNGCLKINDVIKEELRYKPECITIDKDGYNKSLVFSYMCPEQGIYEIGEISQANCKNAYPYAMALKRLIDRVILKNSGVAQYGIYSDSEADEFKEKTDDPVKAETKEDTKNYRELVIELINQKGLNINEIAKQYKLHAKATNEDFKVAYESIKGE